MQAETVITLIVSLGSIVTFLLVTFFFSRKFKPFEKIGTLFDSVMKNDEAIENFSVALSGISEIGTSAKALNVIMQDEELFNDLIANIAKRVVSSIQHSILGIKSGDSRRMAKAESMVNDAIVTGVGKLNPIIGIILKQTGLDEELRKDPEMFGYIMQIIQDRGLLNLIDMGSLATPQLDSKQTNRGFDF